MALSEAELLDMILPPEDVKIFVEKYGFDKLVEVVGIDKLIEAVGIEKLISFIGALVKKNPRLKNELKKLVESS